MTTAERVYEFVLHNGPVTRKEILAEFHLKAPNTIYIQIRNLKHNKSIFEQQDGKFVAAEKVASEDKPKLVDPIRNKWPQFEALTQQTLTVEQVPLLRLFTIFNLKRHDALQQVVQDSLTQEEAENYIRVSIKMAIIKGADLVGTPWRDLEPAITTKEELIELLNPEKMSEK